MSARWLPQARTLATILAFLLTVAPALSPAAQATSVSVGLPPTDPDGLQAYAQEKTDLAVATARSTANDTLALAADELARLETAVANAQADAEALLSQDAAWREEVRATPARIYSLLAEIEAKLAEARTAADPRPYLGPVTDLLAQEEALAEDLRGQLADQSDDAIPDAPVQADAPQDPVEHHHLEADGYGAGERRGQSDRVLADDLADDLRHRAYFAMDRNWALVGSPISVTSLSKPADTLTSVQWHFDEHPVAGVGFVGGSSAATAAAIVPSMGPVGDLAGAKLTLRPMQVGLHHLTLTATWTDADGPHVDRVTTPIYVEAPAIATLNALPDTSEWVADVVGTLTAMDAAEAQGTATHTVASLEGLLFQDRPTVLLISDFLGDYGPPAGVVAPTHEALQALADSVSTFDAEHGLGAIDAWGITDYGADITHQGGAMAATLVEAGLANVVFASGIDPDTGVLDRAAIRNALLYAEHSGNIDAVLWGLPASAYLPGALQNSGRPNLNFQSTPMLPMPADAPLPQATRDWHDAPYMPDGTVSVLSELMELGFAVDPGTDGSGLLGRLHANMGAVYSRFKPLVEGVYNDVEFDTFLQKELLALGELGIPTVAPAEECAALASTYMTVLGVGHLLGTYTVAAGTKDDGVDPMSCKGPDRRAHGHGQGIDFVADPRPSKATVLDLVPPGVAGSAQRTIPYAVGSLGAATKVAAKLADLRHSLRDANYPWAAQDLAGMLASHAKASDLTPWDEGAGFVDVDNIPSTLPPVFARQTGITFQPFDLQAGTSSGFVQVVVTGADAATALATADSWDVEGDTRWRMADDGWGGRTVEQVTPETPGHIGVHQVEAVATPVAPDVTIVTLQMAASPQSASGGGWMGTPWAPPRDWLLPGLYSGRTWISTSSGVLQLPLNLGVGTIVDVYRFLAPDKPVGDTLVCLALPDVVGDVLGLRETSHELGLDELCLYVASTDVHGVARFYTPLPLIPYKLISWFDGRFNTRGGGIGKVYPHIEVKGVSFPLPLNLGGVAGFVGEAVGSGANYSPPAPQDLPEEGLQLGWAEADATPENPAYPVFLRADLPYPLLYIPINMTFQLAIGVNWRYHDNMETDHYVPVTTTSLTGVLDLLTGGRLPGFVDDLYFEAVQTSQELQKAAAEVEGQILDTVPSDLPVLNGTILDDILDQGVLKSLPLDLGGGGGTCQWGYGHGTSPAITPEMAPILAAPDHQGWSAANFLAEMARPAVDREAKDPNQFAWPDTLLMRSNPTLESLLTLGLQLPLCSAAYSFNVPQPNKYPTSVVHSFDLHLENTILIVCIASGMDTVCWILLPSADGLLDIVPWDLDGRLRDLLRQAGGLVDFGVPPVPNPVVPPLTDLTGGVRDLLRVPDVNIALPILPDIQTVPNGGRVTLATDLVTAGARSGLISYTAIPLAVADTGLLDPIVGILTANGIDVAGLLKSARLNATVPGLDMVANVTADLPGLLRDSIQDLLGIQSKVGVTRATFDLNTWWWDDSFFDAPIAPSFAMPRSTTTDCLRRWDVATDPAAMAGPRWPADGDDPTCLRDATGHIILRSGTAGTPNGGFDLGEDWWWRTFPNVDRQVFQRGLRYWDPETLVPDRAAMAADGYPWDQPEMFEVLLEQFDDEQITSTLPNQNHFHAGNGHNAHDFVSTAKHCTQEDVHSTATGASLLDAHGEYCYEGLLAFEEGDGYLFHDNDQTGSGIYDPDMGLGGVDATLLPLLDLLGLPTAVNPVVWSLGIQWGDTRATTPGLVENVTGHDPRELAWWSRGVSFTANRTIYSDQYTNSTLLLGDHFKPCEEIALFSRAVIFNPEGVFDRHPRWQTACPVLPGPEAERARAADPALPKGFVPAGFEGSGKPAHWDWQPRLMDMGPDSQLLTAPTVDGFVQEGPLLPPWLSPPSAAPEGQAWYANEGLRCRRERWMGWPAGASAEAREQAITAYFLQQAQPIHEAIAVAPFAGQETVSGYKDQCGDYDGWTYWVRADLGFNGGPVPRWNHYIRNLHPIYSNGTFALDAQAWDACRATPDHQVDGWKCDAPDPISQAWRDLLANAPARHEAFTDPRTGNPVDTAALLADAARADRFWVAKALWFFGMDVEETGLAYNPDDSPVGTTAGLPYGPDRTERVVTVPLAANPDGWYGAGPEATEWDAFFRNMGFRQIDWNPNDPRVQVTNLTLLQDSMADLSFLLRAYLEGDAAAASSWWASPAAHPADGGVRLNDYLTALPAWTSEATGPNPFWHDVTGHYVSYVELDRPRRDDTGHVCVGQFWKDECHRFEVKMDAGDLTGLRPAGPWEKDRTANGAPLPKDATAFIPQGSSYARWNRGHRIPVDLPVDGGLAIDELHALPTTVPTCSGTATQHWIRTSETRHAPDGWTAEPLGPAGAPTATLPGWWSLTACSTDTTPWQAWAALVHFEAGAWTDPAGYALPPALGAALTASDDLTAVKQLHAYYTFGEKDPNDPLGMARVTVSTRHAPDAAHPLGYDSGCWFDRRTEHGFVFPHQEFSMFDTTFWDNVVRSGFYNHHERNAHQSWNGVSGLGGLLSGDDYDARYDEPVPPTRFGSWCILQDPDTGENTLVPGRSEREYIQQRLAWDMQGGSRHKDRTMLAPANPFGPVGRPEQPLELDLRAILALLEALLNDATRLADLGITAPDVSGAVADVFADTHLTEHTGDLAAAARNLRDTLVSTIPVDVTLDAATPDLVRFDLASPVVPIANVHVAGNVNVAEVAVRQAHHFPAGTQGIFVTSDDSGKTWHQVPGRLKVGVTSEGSDAVGGGRLEFLDMSRHTGDSVLLGVQLLGAGWDAATWRIDELHGYGTGVASGAGPRMAAFPGSLAGAVTFDPAHVPGQTWASLASLPAGSVVRLQAPLTIPDGQTLQLNGVQLVAGQCGDAACPITVDGTLRLVGGGIAPATAPADGASQVAQGAIVEVRGVLETLGATVRGLLGGIHVLGGKVTGRDCWYMDTGVLAVASVFGELDFQDCVFSGQTVGVYTLGSHVRLEGNLFVRMDRVAGAFDDSWGTVRGNAVLHAEKAGFLVKGPLGAQNMAILDNHVRETSTGMASMLALETRLLGVNPLWGGVPLEARTRYQGNDVEFATLQGVLSGLLSQPYFVGNDLTHDGFGATAGMLQGATFRHNSLYRNFNGWMDPVRADPPQGDAWFEAGNAPQQFLAPVRRGPVPEDGNLLAGARGGGNRTFDQNYWGPSRVGGSPEGRIAKGAFDAHPLPAYPDKPAMAMLTAPAYGGGALPGLTNTTGSLLDLDRTILGVGGPSLPIAGLPDLVDLEDIKLGLFHDRPFPVDVDVPAGVTSVQVKAKFYDSPFMPLLGLLDLGDLNGDPLGPFADQLRDLVGKLKDEPSPTRELTATLDVPPGQTHAGTTLTFDGIAESYVDVQVVSFTVDPNAWSPARMAAMGATPAGTDRYAGDGLLTKDVRVHNSITWPLLLDLTALVHDLTFSVVNDTLEVFDQTVQGLGMPLSASLASAAGLPVLPMPDGTLPIHAVPDLLTLAKDQDPVRGIEARFELGADLGVQTGVLATMGFDKSAILPDLPEGVTLAVQARAMDASNLVSPWVGVRLLTDLHAPSIVLNSECVSDSQGGIPYEAHEWRGDGWGANRRGSGIRSIAVRAAPVVQVAGIQPVRVDVPFPGDDVVGTVVLPPEGMVDGMVYQVRAVAQDRAGNAGTDSLTRLVVDLSAPRIELGALLNAIMADAQAGKPFIGLDDLTGGDLAVRIDVEDGPQGVDDALHNSCGLLTASLEMRTAADGQWHTVQSASATDQGTRLDLDADIDILGALSGRYLELRVRAQDGAGHETVVTTGNLLADLTIPVPIALPGPFTCLGANPATIPLTWGGRDAVPAGGVAASGLESGQLLAIKPTGTTTLDSFTAPVGTPTVTRTYSLDPRAQLGSGTVVLAVRLHDHADNERLWDSVAGLPSTDVGFLGSVAVDLNAPAQTSLSFRHWEGTTAAALSTDPLNGDIIGLDAFVDDAVGGLYSCGLKLVQLFLDSAAGNEVLSTDSPTGTADAFYGRTVDLATKAGLDGRYANLRLHAEDKGGNALDVPSSTFLVDLTSPTFTLPTLPTCIGPSGLSLSWTATDPARAGVTYPYTPSGIQTNFARLTKNGAAWTTVVPGVAAAPSAGDHGKVVAATVEVSDRAGNKVTGGFPGSATIDLTGPTSTLGLGGLGIELIPAAGGVDSGQVHLVATAADVGCAGATGLHVFAQRIVDGVAWGSPVDLGASPVNWSDPLSTDPALWHHNVKYSVYARDALGNQGATLTTQQLQVDYRYPTLDLGSTAAFFGHTVATSGELLLPASIGVVDLGAGFGDEDGTGKATVVSHGATALSGYGSLPITATATFPGAVALKSIAATRDGTAVTLSGTGPWTYSYSLSLASVTPRNAEHTYQVTLTGTNGLTTSVRHRIHVPQEATVNLEETGTWSKTGTGTADRVTTPVAGGTYAIRVDATTAQAVELRRADTNTANPSVRLSVLADVRVERKDATGDLRLLDVLDQGSTSRIALVLKDASRQLYLRTSAGDTATGETLPLGSYVRVALVLRGTLAELHVAGRFIGEYTVPTPASGISGIAVGGTGGKAYVDDLQVKGLDLAVRSVLESMPINAGTAGLWTSPDPAVSVGPASGIGLTDQTVRVDTSGTAGEAYSPTFSASSRAHMAVHFLPESAHDTSEVARFLDAAGNVVMTAKMDGTLLHVSDGGGTYKTFSATMTPVWHRLEVYQEGSFYVAQLDQEEVLLLKTERTAPVARLAVGSGGTALQFDEIHVLDTVPNLDRSTGATGTDLWTTGGNAAAITTATIGHWTPKAMVINPSGTDTSYVAASLAAVGTAYTAQVAFRPSNVNNAPDKQWLLAFTDGSATPVPLHGVYVMPHGSAPLYGGYDLLYQGPSGTPVNVLYVPSGSDWQTVAVHVDRVANRVAIEVNEGTPTVLTYASVPAAVKVATGDLSTSATSPSGSGSGIYDDLRVLPGWE